MQPHLDRILSQRAQRAGQARLPQRRGWDGGQAAAEVADAGAGDEVHHWREQRALHQPQVAAVPVIGACRDTGVRRERVRDDSKGL